MNHIVAGLLAGAVLAVALTIYLFLRGSVLVSLIRKDEDIENMNPQAYFYLFLNAFILASLGIGALSGLIYQRLGSQSTFTGLFLGAAVLLNFMMLARKTPLRWDKIIIVSLVGSIIGFLTPLFAA